MQETHEKVLRDLKEALERENPEDVFQFCSDYFAGILKIQRASILDISLASLASRFFSNVSYSQKNTQNAPSARNAPEIPNSAENTQNSALNNTQKNPINTQTKIPKTSSNPTSSEHTHIYRNRRISVSAESMNPSSSTYIPIIHKKSILQQQRINTAIRQNLLFKACDEDQFTDVVNAMVEMKFDVGVDVIKQGDEGDYFYVVEEGVLECWVTPPPEKVCVYNNAGTFGELALMYNSPRAATVRTTTPCTLYALARPVFRRILMENTSRKRKMYEGFLEDLPLLATLTPYERSKIADTLESVTVNDGEFVICQGEVGDSFYFIEAGEAVAIKNVDGVDRVVKSLRKGDYFGALLNNQPRQASIKAVGRLKVATMDKKAFVRLLGPVIDIIRRNTNQYSSVPDLTTNSFNQTDNHVSEDVDHESEADESNIEENVFEEGAEQVDSAFETSRDNEIEEDNEDEEELNDADAEEMDHEREDGEEEEEEEVEEEEDDEIDNETDDDFLDEMPAIQSQDQNRTRRISVSAESMNPTTEPYIPLIIPKTEDQKSRIHAAIKQNLLFKSCDEEQYRDVVNAMSEKFFSANVNVIVQGDEGDFFYVIESGILDVYVSKNDSPPVKVFQYTDSGSFGELALMYNSPRAATIKTVTDSVLWALDRVTFRRILMENTSRKRRMYESFLEDLQLLSTLEPYERSKIADALESITVNDGEDVIVQGEVGDQFYIIESGEANAIKVVGGVEKIVKSLKKGDYFGELALLNDQPRQATIRAVGRLKVATMGKKAFVRLLGPVIDIIKRNTTEYLQKAASEEELIVEYEEEEDEVVQCKTRNNR